MVELVINTKGTPVQNLAQCMLAQSEMERTAWDYFRVSYKAGDIMKVVPKKWHKYFDLGDDKRIIRVWNINFIGTEKMTLTEPLKAPSGVIMQRRRYAVDLKKLKDKPVTFVWSLKSLLIDKENI